MNETLIKPETTFDANLLEELNTLKQNRQELENKRYLDASLAQFAGIMRWQVNDTLQTWADRLLSELVSYINGLQASLYMADEAMQALDWIGGYACPAETAKKVIFGEGLTGQAAKSAVAYYYDEPDTFSAFSYSSLSSIPAKVLLVLPLVYNDKVEGVLELSGVRAFTDIHMELVRGLSESIAANMGTIRNQESVKRLFEEAQTKSEMLSAQEEELRQNLEELQATQDEMKRIQDELVVKEREFRQMADSVPGMIFQFYLKPDGQSGLQYVSAGAKDILEQDLAVITSLTLPEVITIHPEDAAAYEERLTESARNLSPYQMYFRIVMKDGRVKWLNAQSTPMALGNGTLVWNGVITDITREKEVESQIQQKNEELKAQEEELRQNLEELEATQEEMRRTQRLVEDNETKLRGVINSTADLILAVDTEIRILTYNEAMYQSFAINGFQMEVGRSLLDFITADQQELIASQWKRVLAGEGFVVEFSFSFSENDAPKHFRSSYEPMLDATGKVWGGVVFAKDVTQQKELELDKARQQKEIEALMEATQQQNEELKAQEEELRQNLEELEATQEEVLRGQKETARLLQRFDLATQTTTEGLWDMEMPADNRIEDNTPFFWSDRFRYMLGFSNEEDFPNVLHSWADLLHPDHKQQTLNAFNAHLLDTTGNTPYNVEYQLQLKDGNWRWFRAVGNTARDEHGNPLRVAGSLIDIQPLRDTQALQDELERKVSERTAELKAAFEATEQKNSALEASQAEVKEAQIALTRQKDHLSAILNSSPDLIGVLNPELRLINFNEAYAAAFRAAGHELELGMHLLEFINYEEYPAVEALWKRALSGEEFTQENAYSFAEGAEKQYFEVTYKTMRDSNGTILGAVLFSKNISAYRLQESSLLAQYNTSLKEIALLKSLLEYSNDAIILIDTAYRVIQFNQCFRDSCARQGLAVKEGSKVFTLFPQAGKDKIKALLDRALAGERFTELEQITDPGTQASANLESNYYPLQDAQGNIYGVYVTAKELFAGVSAPKTTVQNKRRAA